MTAVRLADTWHCVTGSWDALSPHNQVVFIGTIVSLLLLLWRTAELKKNVAAIQNCREAEQNAVLAAKGAAETAKALPKWVKTSEAVVNATTAATGAAASAKAAEKAAERAACFAGERLTDHEIMFQRMPMGSATVVVNRVSRWRYLTHPWPLLWPYLYLRRQGQHLMKRINWRQDAMRSHAECKACDHQRHIMLGTSRLWLLACDPMKHEEVRRVEKLVKEIYEAFEKREERMEDRVLLLCPEGWEKRAKDDPDTNYFMERSCLMQRNNKEHMHIVEVPQYEPESLQLNATERSVVMEDIGHTTLKTIATIAARAFTVEALHSVTITLPPVGQNLSEFKYREDVSEFTCQLHESVRKVFHQKESLSMRIPDYRHGHSQSGDGDEEQHGAGDEKEPRVLDGPWTENEAEDEEKENEAEDEEKEQGHQCVFAEGGAANGETGPSAEIEAGAKDTEQESGAAGKDVEMEQRPKQECKRGILCIDLSLESWRPECRWCGQSGASWSPPALDARLPTLDERLQHDRECPKRPRCVCRREAVQKIDAGKVVDALDVSGPSRSHWANARVAPDIPLPLPFVAVGAWFGAYFGRATAETFACDFMAHTFRDFMAQGNRTWYNETLTMYHDHCESAEIVEKPCIHLHYIGFCSALISVLVVLIASLPDQRLGEMNTGKSENCCAWRANGCAYRGEGTDLKEHEKHCPYRLAYDEEMRARRSSTFWHFRIFMVAVLTGITVMPNSATCVADGTIGCSDLAHREEYHVVGRILAASGSFIMMTKDDSQGNSQDVVITASIVFGAIFSGTHLVSCIFPGVFIGPATFLVPVLCCVVLAVRLALGCCCSRMKELSLPIFYVCSCSWVICYGLHDFGVSLDEIEWWILGLLLGVTRSGDVPILGQLHNFVWRLWIGIASTCSRTFSSSSQTAGAVESYRRGGTVVRVKYDLDKKICAEGQELNLPADETVEGLKQRIAHIHQALRADLGFQLPAVQQHIVHCKRGVLHNEMNIASECMRCNSDHVVELTVRRGTLRLSSHDCVEIFLLTVNASAIAGGFAFLVSDGVDDYMVTPPGGEWTWRHVIAAIACIASFMTVWSVLWNADWYRKQDMDILPTSSEEIPISPWAVPFYRLDYANMWVRPKKFRVTQRTQSMWQTRMAPLLRKLDPEQSSVIFLVYAVAVMAAIGRQIENLVCGNSEDALFDDRQARWTMLLEFLLFIMVSFTAGNFVLPASTFSLSPESKVETCRPDYCKGQCGLLLKWSISLKDAVMSSVTDAALMLRFIPAVYDVIILLRPNGSSFKFNDPTVQLVLNGMRVVILVKRAMAFEPQMEIIRGVHLGGCVSQITVGARHTRSHSGASNKDSHNDDEGDKQKARDKRVAEDKLKMWLYERLCGAEPEHLWDPEPTTVLAKLGSLLEQRHGTQRDKNDATQRVLAMWAQGRLKRETVAKVLRELGILSVTEHDVNNLVLPHARFKRDTVATVLREAGIPCTEQDLNDLVLPHESPPCVRCCDRRLLKMTETTFNRHLDGETGVLPLSTKWKASAVNVPTSRVVPLPRQWEGESKHKSVSFTGWIPLRHVDEKGFHRCRAATKRRTELSQALYAALTFTYGGLAVVQCRYKAGCNFPTALMICFALDALHRFYSAGVAAVSKVVRRRYQKRLHTHTHRRAEQESNGQRWYRMKPHLWQTQLRLEKSINVDTTMDLLAAIVALVSVLLELLGAFKNWDTSGTVTNFLLRVAICGADITSREVDVLPLGVLRSRQGVSAAPYGHKIVGVHEGHHAPEPSGVVLGNDDLCMEDDTEHQPADFIASKKGPKTAFHMSYSHVDSDGSAGHRGAGSFTVRNELERYKALVQQWARTEKYEDGASQWWRFLSDFARCTGCKLNICKPKLIFTVAPRGCTYEEIITSRDLTYDAVEQAQAQKCLDDTKQMNTKVHWSKLKNAVRITGRSRLRQKEEAKKKWGALRTKLTVAAAFSSEQAGSDSRQNSFGTPVLGDAGDGSDSDHDHEDGKGCCSRLCGSSRDEDHGNIENETVDYSAPGTDAQQILASTAQWKCTNEDCDVGSAYNSYLQLQCVVCGAWGIPKLHRAAFEGDKNEVRELLNKGKKFTGTELDEHLDMYGRTALYFCTDYPYKAKTSSRVKTEHHAIATLLRNRGAKNTLQSTREKSENHHWKHLRLKTNIGAFLGKSAGAPAVASHAPHAPTKTIPRKQLVYFASHTCDPLLESNPADSSVPVSDAVTAMRNHKRGTMWRCESCLKYNVSLAEVCVHCDVARHEVRKISVRACAWDDGSGNAARLDSYVMSDGSGEKITHAIGIDYQSRPRKQVWESFSTQFDNKTGQIRVFGSQNLSGWQVCSQECHAEGANIMVPARVIPSMKGELYKKVDEAQWKLQMKAKLTQKKATAAISVSDMWHMHYCVLDALTCSIRLYESEDPKALCVGTYRIHCKPRSLRQGGYRGCEDMPEKRLIVRRESFRFTILLASDSGDVSGSLIVAAKSQALKREWMQRLDEAAKYYQDTLHVKDLELHRKQLEDGRSRLGEVKTSEERFNLFPRWEISSELTWRYFTALDRQRIAFQELKYADDIRQHTERLHVLAAPIPKTKEAKELYDGELLEEGDRVVVHEEGDWYGRDEGEGGWSKQGTVTNVRGVLRDEWGDKRINASPTYDVKYDPVGGGDGYKNSGVPIRTHEVIVSEDAEDKYPGKIKFNQRLPEHWFPRWARGGGASGERTKLTPVRLSTLGGAEDKDFPQAEPPLNDHRLYFVKKFDNWTLRLFLTDTDDAQQAVQFKGKENFCLVLQVFADDDTDVPRHRIQRCTWIEIATQSNGHRKELKNEINSLHERGDRGARKEKLIRRKNPKKWSARKAVICHLVAAGCGIAWDEESHCGLKTFYWLYFTSMSASMLSCFGEHSVSGLCPGPETFCHMRCVLLLTFSSFALVYTMLFNLREDGKIPCLGWCFGVKLDRATSLRSLCLKCMVCLMVFAFLWNPKCAATDPLITNTTSLLSTTAQVAYTSTSASSGPPLYSTSSPVMATTSSPPTVDAPLTTTAGVPTTTTAGAVTTTTAGAPTTTTAGAVTTTTAGAPTTTTGGAPTTTTLLTTSVPGSTTSTPPCECRTMVQGNWTVVPECGVSQPPDNVCHAVRTTMHHASAGAMSVFTMLSLALWLIAKMLQALFPYCGRDPPTTPFPEKVSKFCKRLAGCCKAQWQKRKKLKKKLKKMEETVVGAAEESWVDLWKALVGAAVGSLVAAALCRFVEGYEHFLSDVGLPGFGPVWSWGIIVAIGGGTGFLYQHVFCRLILPLVSPIKRRAATWILWRADKLWSTGLALKDYRLGETLWNRRSRMLKAQEAAKKNKEDGVVTEAQRLQKAYPQTYESRWPGGAMPPCRASPVETGAWEGAIAGVVRVALVLTSACYVLLLPLVGFLATKSVRAEDARDTLPGLVFLVMYVFPFWSHMAHELSWQAVHRAHDLTARNFSWLFWGKDTKDKHNKALKANVMYQAERRSVEQFCQVATTRLGKSRRGASWLSKGAYEKAQRQHASQAIKALTTLPCDNAGTVAAPGMPYTIALQANPRSRPGGSSGGGGHPALKFKLDERTMWRGEGMHYRSRRDSKNAEDRWELLNPEHYRVSDAFALTPAYYGGWRWGFLRSLSPLFSIQHSPSPLFTMPRTLFPHEQHLGPERKPKCCEKVEGTTMSWGNEYTTALMAQKKLIARKKKEKRGRKFDQNCAVEVDSWGELIRAMKEDLWGKPAIKRAYDLRQLNPNRAYDRVDNCDPLNEDEENKPLKWHATEFNSQRLFGPLEYVALVMRWLWYSKQLVVDLGQEDSNSGKPNCAGKRFIERLPARSTRDVTQDGYQALGVPIKTSQVFTGGGSDIGKIKFNHKHWLCGTAHGGDGSFDRVRLSKLAQKFPEVDGEALDTERVYFVKKYDDYTLRLFLPTDTERAVKFNTQTNFCLTLHVVEDAFGNPFAVHDMSFRLFERVERYFCDATTAQQEYVPVGKWIDKPRREYVLAREPYLHQCRDCVPNRVAGCGFVDRAWLDLLAFVAWLITVVLGHELSKENAKWEYVSFVYFLYVSACVAYYFLYKVPKKEFVGGIFWEDDIALSDFHRAALAGNLDDLRLIFKYYHGGRVRCSNCRHAYVEHRRRLPIPTVRDAPDRFGRTALYFCTKSEFKQGDSAGCEAYLRTHLGAETLYACECVRCGWSGHKSTFERLSDHDCTSAWGTPTETSSEAGSERSLVGVVHNPLSHTSPSDRRRQSMTL